MEELEIQHSSMCQAVGKELYISQEGTKIILRGGYFYR
jgi:hypothetical protein